MGCAIWVAFAFSDQLTLSLVAAFILSIVLGVVVFTAPHLMEYWMEQQKTKLRQAKAEETLLNAVEQAEEVARQCKEMQQEVMKGVLVIRQAPQKIEELSEKLELLLAQSDEKLIAPLNKATDLFSGISTDTLHEQLKAIRQDLNELKLPSPDSDSSIVDLNPIEKHILRIEQFLTQNVSSEPPELLHFEAPEDEQPYKPPQPNSETEDSIPFSDAAILPEARAVTPSDEEEEDKTTDFPSTVDAEKSTDTSELRAEPDSVEPEEAAPTEISEEIVEQVDKEPSVKDEEPQAENVKEQEAPPESGPQEIPEPPTEDLESDPLQETQTEPQEFQFGDEGDTETNHPENLTQVMVDAFIGVSNKLFIRGDAPGLSWDKGTPMDLVGIGKWEWKSQQVTQAFNCRVYINDNPEMDSAQFEVTPGGTFSTSVSF